MSATATKQRPPKDGLERTRTPGLEVRAVSDGSMPTLFGYFLRFDEWTEINSLYEGRFMERITSGAASKTLSENRDGIRILFNHGYDPQIGEKPLTKPELTEDKSGVKYEGELFDTSYNRDLVPALEAGVLGASFCFRVVQETWNEEPGPSPSNPLGLPERTLTEIGISEGGPVTFPAYEGATAGVRSTTDARLAKRLVRGGSPDLEEEFAVWVKSDPKRTAAILAGVTESGAEDRKAIAYKETATSERSWDGPATEASIDNAIEADELREFFAWVDPGADADTKAAYKFIHHENEDDRAAAANLEACSNGIAVLNGDADGTTIPAEDRQGVYDHLARHLKDADKEAPELKDRSKHFESTEVVVDDTPAGESRSEDGTNSGTEDTPALTTGAERTHSDVASREAPWRSESTTDTPPWRRNSKPTSPWTTGEKE